MKLYVENGRIYFDYTDVDPNAPLSVEAAECREWLWAFRWQPAAKENVRVFANIQPNDYIGLQAYAYMLTDMRSMARRGRGFVAVDKSFDGFYNRVNSIKCKLFEDEQRRLEARKRAEEWKCKCSDGCGRCEHLRCVGDDDYACAATGEDLEVRNRPRYSGGIYLLFRLVPFPTVDCPFNVNKTEAKING